MARPVQQFQFQRQLQPQPQPPQPQPQVPHPHQHQHPQQEQQQKIQAFFAPPSHPSNLKPPPPSSSSSAVPFAVAVADPPSAAAPSAVVAPRRSSSGPPPPHEEKRPKFFGNRKSASSATAVVAPGGGTNADLASLSRSLGLTVETVRAFMESQGRGVRRSGRRGGGGGGKDEEKAGEGAGAGAPKVQSSPWADFMSDAMDGGGGGGGGGADAKAGSDAGGKAMANAADDDEGGARTYDLPILPRMNPVDPTARSKKKSKKAAAADSDSAKRFVAPGVLVQTGTLDAATIGRTKRPMGAGPHDLEEPTLLFPSIFAGVKIASIAASSTSVHSIAVDVHGTPYGWGRNESCQLGSGSPSSVVVSPRKLDGPWDETPIVGAATGKSHTCLVDRDGVAYGAGSNKVGQCGVNSSTEACMNFRKCYVSPTTTKKGGKVDRAGDGSVKMVQVSCGENFTVLLSSAGHLYTAGSSEFGQLGNGETGEYFVAANKLAFANSTKFERRSRFVQSPADADPEWALRHGNLVTEGKANEMIPLSDTSEIVIGSVACGKNHAVAVEAASSRPPRVFTWGCGDYGCLGHNVQADEYTPRLVSALRGPLFASNAPIRAAAGYHCSMVLTRNGHVYYWGKHRQIGEATMRPTLVDALANNGHVVSALSAGSQTVFASTANGATVSWGNGPHGELGYGKDNPKSSSKPKFVSKLDECMVSDVRCGMGHTLFLVRDEDEEDRKALKKLKVVEEGDVAEFVASVGGA